MDKRAEANSAVTRAVFADDWRGIEKILARVAAKTAVDALSNPSQEFLDGSDALALAEVMLNEALVHVRRARSGAKPAPPPEGAVYYDEGNLRE